MSMTGKAAGRMHILFHGSFQDLTVLFHSGQERDQSPVSPIMKKAVSKHSVTDQNLNISAPDHVEMQSSCRACLSCRSLRIKFLASLFTVKLFIFLYSTMICQNRNPNLFLGIPWWPNKFSFELFSLPHSTGFPPLCTIQGFCHVWMMLFVQEYLNRAWIDTGTCYSAPACIYLSIFSVSLALGAAGRIFLSMGYQQCFEIGIKSTGSQWELTFYLLETLKSLCVHFEAKEGISKSQQCKQHSWFLRNVQILIRKIKTLAIKLTGSSYLASYKYSWRVVSSFQRHKKFCFVRIAIAHILQSIKKKVAWHGFLELNYLHERLVKLDPFSIIKRLFTMIWNQMLSWSV